VEEVTLRKLLRKLRHQYSINLFDAIGGGKTKLISLEELRNLGVARVSVPVGTILQRQKALKLIWRSF